MAATGSVDKLAWRACVLCTALDELEMGKQRGSRERKGYLHGWLHCKPDRCQDKHPENSKGSATGVSEAEPADFRLVTSARRGRLRGYMQCNRDKRPERSAADGSEHASPGEYCTRPSRVQVFRELVCAGRVERFERPTRRARDQRGRDDVW